MVPDTFGCEIVCKLMKRARNILCGLFLFFVSNILSLFYIYIFAIAICFHYFYFWGVDTRVIKI